MKINSKDGVAWLGTFVSLGGMLYLIQQLHYKHLPIVFVTWLLWVVIDALIVIVTYKVGYGKKDFKHPILMIMYTVTTFLILLLAIKNIVDGRSKLEWINLHTFITIVVILALVVWRKLGDTGGLIATVAAMVIAGIPTQVGAWTNPKDVDILFWSLSGTGCFLSYIAAPKTLFGRLMPGCGAVANLVTVLFALTRA